jgi:cytochrome b561
MAHSGTKPGYTGTAKALHWIILALLIVQFILAWTMPDIRRDTKPDTLINLHLSFGMLILAVVIVRLGWRMTHLQPPPEAGTPAWQVQSSSIVHWLLYVLLVVVPILGWVNASWRGFPVVLFGLFELPKLLATRALGWAWTGDVHGLLANYAVLALVGLHTAAALYHHFVRRDGVLQRMLPGV